MGKTFVMTAKELLRHLQQHKRLTQENKLFLQNEEKQLHSKSPVTVSLQREYGRPHIHSDRFLKKEREAVSQLSKGDPFH